MKNIDCKCIKEEEIEFKMSQKKPKINNQERNENQKSSSTKQKVTRMKLAITEQFYAMS